MPSREAGCPLCGARLTAEQVLAHGDEVADLALGVVACRCPFCQGYFELRAGAEGLEVGYLRHGRFDRVLTLPVPGSLNCQIDTHGLSLRIGNSVWRFEA